MTTPTEVSTLGTWINDAPLRKSAVSLILTLGYTVWQEHTLDGKRTLLEKRGTLLVAWTGQYRTDVRLVTESERQALADAIA